MKGWVGEGRRGSNEAWNVYVYDRQRCLVRDRFLESPEIGPEVFLRLNDAFQERLLTAVAVLNLVGDFLTTSFRISISYASSIGCFP